VNGKPTGGGASPQRPPRIFLRRLDKGYDPAVREGLEWTGIARRLRPGDVVFLKPNLTFPRYRPGVMTSPACIEALVRALKDHRCRVIVGEADGGGYNRFAMDEVFRETGLAAMARRLGFELVNLSKLPARTVRFVHRGRPFAVPLPVLLLDEVDHFITCPVPKVHANTTMSGAIKNQWGCIQEPSLRLRLHPFFAAVVHAINRALRVGLCVMDGRYGLDRNGPLRGDAVALDWLMVADDVLAADVVACTLMGLEPMRIGYLRHFQRRSPVPPIGAFDFNTDYRAFAGARFQLKRELWDWPGFLAFRSRWLAWLAYHSPFARTLHRGLYLFREKFYEHD